MSTVPATHAERLTGSISPVFDAAPFIPDVETGELVPLGSASLDQAAGFLETLREMRRIVQDAESVVVSEIAQRADAAGTRTLHAATGKVVVSAGERVDFGLDSALAELEALSIARGLSMPVGVVAGIHAIVRERVTREPDHAAIKRLRAMGDREVIAILDKHTTTTVADRRTVAVKR